MVDAVLSLGDLLPLNMIGIKKVTGGALEVGFSIFTDYSALPSYALFNLVHYDSYPYAIYAMTNTIQDSQLVHGVSFKKTFSYAGFEMQPKKYITPKV